MRNCHSLLLEAGGQQEQESLPTANPPASPRAALTELGAEQEREVMREMEDAGARLAGAEELGFFPEAMVGDTTPATGYP